MIGAHYHKNRYEHPRSETINNFNREWLNIDSDAKDSNPIYLGYRFLLFYLSGQRLMNSHPKYTRLF